MNLLCHYILAILVFTVPHAANAASSLQAGIDESALIPRTEKAHKRSEADIGQDNQKQEMELGNGKSFKDCRICPEMIAIPYASQPFAAGKYEVTFAEWDACVADNGCNGYSPNDQGWGRDNRPVINVNWNDAKQFVQWLAQRTGKNYRLLGGAEWEYAARAGTTTAYSFGNSVAQLKQHVWYSANSGKQSHPVGEKKPNAFGLYDMHGNVWEWVDDCQNSDCSRRVVRGGSWYGNPFDARSASRSGVDISDRHYDIGFRVARTLP